MKPGPDEIAARRARVRRLAAHRAARPGLQIEVVVAPEAGAAQGLVDLLAELLDARRRSGRW